MYPSGEPHLASKEELWHPPFVIDQQIVVGTSALTGEKLVGAVVMLNSMNLQKYRKYDLQSPCKGLVGVMRDGMTWITAVDEVGNVYFFSVKGLHTMQRPGQCRSSPEGQPFLLNSKLVGILGFAGEFELLSLPDGTDVVKN